MSNNEKVLHNYILRKKKKQIKKKKLKNLFKILLICTIGLILFKYTSNNISNTFSATKKDSSTPISTKMLSPNDDDLITVCIDAGHGDWDVGAEGITGSYEKDINLAVALKVGELLEASGINVVYTRTSDNLTWSDNSTENLYERVAISQNNNSDLFISIHCNNSDESSSYNGVETWYNPKDADSEYFATLIQDELSSLEYTYDRGIKYYAEDYTLAVLEHNTVPSALIELGFLSNYSDESFLLSENGQSICAQAICNAIENATEEILNIR